MQVVIQEPIDDGSQLGTGVKSAGLLGGIGAEQVVEGVPAGNVLGDQAGTGELAEQLACLHDVQAGEAGGG